MKKGENIYTRQLSSLASISKSSVTYLLTDVVKEQELSAGVLKKKLKTE